MDDEEARRAKATALADQWGATAADVASVIREYHLALLGLGFKEADAISLTMAFSNIFWYRLLNAKNDQ